MRVKEGCYLPRRKFVKDEDLAARVDLLPRLNRTLNDLARRQPGLCEVVQAFLELVSAHLARLEEALEEDVLVGRLVPPRVQGADARGDVGARAVPGRLGRDVLRDAVVDAVEGLNEVGVHLEVESVDDGRTDGLVEEGREDLLAEVPTDNKIRCAKWSQQRGGTHL